MRSTSWRSKNRDGMRKLATEKKRWDGEQRRSGVGGGGGGWWW